MQGITPYNQNFNSYGEDADNLSDKPHYVFRKPKRKFYFYRIAIFIIAICLLLAGSLWYFNRTPGNLILKQYNLYFVGEFSINENFDNESRIVFDLNDSDFLTCITGSIIGSRYFVADKVYFTLHDAEIDVLEGAESEVNRDILIFSAKNLTLKADKNYEINQKTTRLYNDMYDTLIHLDNLLKTAVNKSISKAMLEYRIVKIREAISDTIDDVILENITISSFLTYFYTLMLNDISNIFNSEFDLNFFNLFALKSTYNFYLTIERINRVK